LSSHPDRMLPFLGKARVVDDPRFCARKASSNPSNNREAAWPGPHARSRS
jgi:hypothetical protein